jgi:hypothetical protein
MVIIQKVSTSKNMKIRKLTPPPVKPLVWINVSRTCIRDYWDGEDYGEWEREYSCTVGDRFAKNEGIITGYDAESIRVEPDVLDADEVYAVVVTYGSGDTFGHSTGEKCVPHIVTKLEEAVKIEKSINDGSYKGYAPWNGYFESLEDTEIKKLIEKK